MRIRTVALIFIGIAGAHFPSVAFAESVCGTFKATIYVPEEGKGAYVFANPKSITKTKLILSKTKTLTPENLGHLLDIEFRSPSVCYLECEVDLVRVVRDVSPFEAIAPYERAAANLVKHEPCKKTPWEATGL